MKTEFSPIETKEYKDSIIEAGLVKNSPHKNDKIYLRIGDLFFHIDDDEAFAILNSLSNALWCEAILRHAKGKHKNKWFPLWEICKDKKVEPKAIQLKSRKVKPPKRT